MELATLNEICKKKIFVREFVTTTEQISNNFIEDLERLGRFYILVTSSKKNHKVIELDLEMQ